MPTPTKYTYATASFLSGAVNTTRLTQEIHQRSDITIALDYVDVDVSSSDIWFKDVLPADQTGSLEAIVYLSHSGEPVSNAQQITGSVSLQNVALATDFALKIQTEPTEGSKVVVTSHDFCDKTTWWGDSVRV